MRRTVRSRALGGVLLVLLLFAAFRLGVLTVPLNLIRMALNPVESFVGTAGERLAGLLSSFMRIGTLSVRVRSLEQERAQLIAEAAHRESVEQENAQLREELKLLPRARFTVVSADVVGPATDGVSTAIRINRGSRDGVSAGAPVIAADGVIVGRTHTVLAGSATVDLLTGGTVRVTARALTTGAEGIVRGTRGLDVLLEGIPRTEELRVGDRLVTSGIDGVFPPHLFVGTVKAVRAPKHAIFQEGTVQLPLNLHRLRTVAVIVEPRLPEP